MNSFLSTVSTSEEDAYGSGREGNTEVTGVLREGFLTVSADLRRIDRVGKYLGERLAAT